MPNLYVCKPRGQGPTLRAILPWQTCEEIAEKAHATYLGQKFPRVSPSRDQLGDFAIVGVGPGEARGQWRSGFYYLKADPMAISEVLERLTI
jgi:hypothetical protein